MINEFISEKVLSVAPEYKNFRGGIGAVLKSYSENFKTFKFISTYPNNNSSSIFKIFFKFISSYFKICILLISDRKIEIVHFHMAAKGSFYRKYLVFVLVKFVFNKKTIIHSHGSKLSNFYFTSNKIVKFLFLHLINSSDIIICLSPQWKSFYLSNFSPKRIVILKNIVAKPIFDFFISNEAKLCLSFLFLGNIGDRKGIFDLLDLIILNKMFLKDKARFYVAGDGDVKKLLKIIKLNDLDGIVEYCGWVSNHEKDTMLNNCDVYLLPSYDEGLPISILEAMSYGKPIISTCVGGIPEIVKDGENGFLIEPGNKKQLWTSILKYLNDITLIKSHGINSLKLVEPYYVENVMDDLENIYRGIIY